LANLSNNPWAIFPADVVTSTTTAITQNSDGTVSVTTSSNHNIPAPPPNQWVTLVNPNPSGYQGFYLVLAVPSATTLTLSPQFPIASGLGAGTTGTVAKNLYPNEVRIEDLSWQNASAAGQLLDLRDRDGNPVWQATAQGAGSQNRGKLFWVEGLTPVLLQSGVVLATIN
jgi:hypothetical protein